MPTMAWLLVALLCCFLLLSLLCAALISVVIGIKGKTHPSENVLLLVRIMCGVAINILRRSQGVIPSGWGHANDSSKVVGLTAGNRRELAVAIKQWRYTVSLVNI